jgi:hypothetical protein
MAKAIVPYPEPPGFDTPAAVRRVLVASKSLIAGDEGRLACGAKSELFRRGAVGRAYDLAVVRRGFRRMAGHGVVAVGGFTVPLRALPGTAARVRRDDAAAPADDRVASLEAVEVRP